VPLPPQQVQHHRHHAAESDHRFGLLRLRESAEAVVLIRGAADEERSLRGLFGGVVAVMLDLLRRERHLMWLGASYGLLAPVLPVLVASPRFLSGAISLGMLMQIALAFTEVTRSLMWFQESYPRLADWRGHVERVLALEDSLAAADAARAASGLAVAEGPDAAGREVLAFSGLRILCPQGGGTVVAEATAEIAAGERVLIRGESGAGKSCLFRAVAGAWPWAEGRVRVPPREAMMVLPQHPYLPLGTLREAVSYPAGPGRFPDAVIGAALARCGLAELAAALDSAERWDGRLSLGQQQRLALARLLLHRPRWVLMDEAISALDEAGQEAMLRLVRAELPGSAMVSIGNRPGLEAYHDRVLALVPGPGGSRLVAAVPVAAALLPAVVPGEVPGGRRPALLPAVVPGGRRAALPPPREAVAAAAVGRGSARAVS
jgi:putative ATP-binding cassette transporter